MMLFAFATVIYLLLGISVAALALDLPERKASALFMGSIGVLIGQALTGVLYGILALAAPDLHAHQLLIETAIMLALVFALAKSGKGVRFMRSVCAKSAIPFTGFDFVMMAFFCVMLVVALTYCILQPNGTWDAWAMWLLKARTLALTGGDIATTLTNGYAHSDYPLLLPFINARGFEALGSLSHVGPVVIAFLQYAAMLGLMLSTVTLLKMRRTAWLFGGIFAAMIFYPRAFSWQYADGFLSALFLALSALMLLVVRERSTGVGTFMMMGMAWGALIYTKNEGLLMGGAFLAGYMLWRLAGRNARRMLLEFPVLLFAAVPFLFLLIRIKMMYPIANDVVDSSLFSRLHLLLEPARYGTILLETFQTFFDLGIWGLLPLLLIFFPFIFRVDADWKRISLASVVPIVLVLLGYAAVYLLTPHDLAWHLDTALERLIGHVMAAALLWLAAIAKPLDE